ncbi:MAG: hypothetical protein OEZ58_18590 [Gammaproteobacteria bacterium]|nr:hypothetical protein [Gammaproteobacteria bacterium]MDH5730999.1 hypothetical protein [Gammaproteobacteria bacterium]
MAKHNVSIADMSLLTSVGANSLQTLNSVMANLIRVKEQVGLYECEPSDQFSDDSETVKAASLYYDDDLKRITNPAQRFAHIAGRALLNLQEIKHFDEQAWAQCGLYICLPEARLNWQKNNIDEFLYHFHNVIQRDFTRNEDVSFIGPVGGLHALSQAMKKIQSGELQKVIVGGVESYLLHAWLHQLDDAYLLKSNRNVDGFIPGEAAGFVLLEAASATKEVKITQSAILQNQDLRSIKTGASLTKLLQTLLQGVSSRPQIVCDLNGQSARMKEWGLAAQRLAQQIGWPPALIHPAANFGDIGAATLPVLMGLGAMMLKQQKVNSSDVLVWCGDRHGNRAGLLLTH